MPRLNEDAGDVEYLIQPDGLYRLRRSKWAQDSYEIAHKKDAELFLLWCKRLQINTVEID